MSGLKQTGNLEFISSPHKCVLMEKSCSNFQSEESSIYGIHTHGRVEGQETWRRKFSRLLGKSLIFWLVGLWRKEQRKENRGEEIDGEKECGFKCGICN